MYTKPWVSMSGKGQRDLEKVTLTCWYQWRRWWWQELRPKITERSKQSECTKVARVHISCFLFGNRCCDVISICHCNAATNPTLSLAVVHVSVGKCHPPSWIRPSSPALRWNLIATSSPTNREMLLIYLYGIVIFIFFAGIVISSSWECGGAYGLQGRCK